MTEDKKIPLYTKIGARVTAVIIIILSVVILKNCVSSIIYGTSTDKSAIEYYYTLGYEDGTERARSKTTTAFPDIENPLLKKAYQRGFRAGWDSVKTEIPPPGTGKGDPEKSWDG